MPYISKIELPDGTEHEFKDEELREAIKVLFESSNKEENVSDS